MACTRPIKQSNLTICALCLRVGKIDPWSPLVKFRKQILVVFFPEMYRVNINIYALRMKINSNAVCRIYSVIWWNYFGNICVYTYFLFFLSLFFWQLWPVCCVAFTVFDHFWKSNLCENFGQYFFIYQVKVFINESLYKSLSPGGGQIYRKHTI